MTSLQRVNMLTKEQIKWLIFYDKMAEGKVPYAGRYCIVDNFVTDNEVNAKHQSQIGGGEVKYNLISPTQQHVEQAKATLKRKIEEGKKRRIEMF